MAALRPRLPADRFLLLVSTTRTTRRVARFSLKPFPSWLIQPYLYEKICFIFIHGIDIHGGLRRRHRFCLKAMAMMP